MFHGSLYPSCKVQYTLARVYTQFNPRKKPSTLHRMLKMAENQCFQCEGLGFQSIHTVPEVFTLTSEAFTRAVNACEGLKKQAFTPENC